MQRLGKDMKQKVQKLHKNTWKPIHYVLANRQGMKWIMITDSRVKSKNTTKYGFE